MNRVISDTAEYGCYLFSHAAVPLLQDFMGTVDTRVIGKGLGEADSSVDNQTLVQVNAIIRDHDVEYIGTELREAMGAMKPITA
jgi:ketol-acid reductoisomerase